MKKIILLSLSILSLTALAATKKYQVTGPVTEITDQKIVVQKGNETWEINKVTESKIPSDLKVGDRVTVWYDISAREVEKKPTKK